MGTSGWDPNYYPTQYEIIKSQPVLTRTIETLNLKARSPRWAARREPHRAVAARALRRAAAATPASSRSARASRSRSSPPRSPTPWPPRTCKYNLDLKLKGAREALAWLDDGGGLAQAEGRRSPPWRSRTTASRPGSWALQEQRQITAAKIMDFNKAYLEAQAQRMSVDAKLHELQPDRQGSPRAPRPSSRWRTTCSSRSSRESCPSSRSTKAKLLKTYKDRHPEIVKVDARIQQVSQKLDGGDPEHAPRGADRVQGRQGARGHAAEQREPAPARGAGSEREGDPVPRRCSARPSRTSSSTRRCSSASRRPA